MSGIFKTITYLLLSMVLFTQTNNIQENILSSAYFDDSGDNLLLGNSYYEISLSKINGGIIQIRDQQSGQIISNGNFNQCLWVVVFSYQTPAEYFESCSFSPAGSNRFAYSWNPTTSRLTLTYTADPTALKSMSATVTITISEDSMFDMQLSLLNNWGKIPDDVKFPSDLVLPRYDIQEALLPVLPGLLLNSGFFSRGKSYDRNYPGEMATDFSSIKFTNSQVTFYSISPADQIIPVRHGFIFDTNPYQQVTLCYQHNYDSGVTDGESWLSPIFRVWIGEDYFSSIQSFREDNYIDLYEPIQTKLGSLYDQVSRSPLYKADLQSEKFITYASTLSNVPYPGILHIVTYWDGPFDHNYPDFQIPNPSGGTKEELIAMMETAQDMGYLVMPYINPTWWDDESPTLLGLPPPLQIKDLAVINADGSVHYKTYNYNIGVVVSPYPDFIQQRLAQLMQDMTEDYPSDMIHEDQVGGRSSLPDYNPASPNIAAYSQGWLDHTETYKNLMLTCEFGHDRLAATETGFHGSLLLPAEEGQIDGELGVGNWSLYPFAPILLRDKVLLYHNTESRTSTTSKEDLALNLSFGYMLSYDLGALTTANPWLPVVGAFQSRVLSKFAEEQITNYQAITDYATQTDFETFKVIRNKSTSSPYTISGYTISTGGAMVTENSGNLIAGIFAGKYNSVALSTGEHYLIEERLADEIIVSQPMGVDTYLTINKLLSWEGATRLGVVAYDTHGDAIGFVPATISLGSVRFQYKSSILSKNVGHYKIYEFQSLFIPITMR